MIPTAVSKTRNFGLDVMRATAILLVLVAHAFHIIAPQIPKSISFISLPDGVDVFFVLSGFLVGGIWIDMLERNESGLLKTFFWKRWLRTLPSYFIVITLLFLLRLYFSAGTFAFPWRYFLFVQNMYVPEWDPYYFYPEAWSLSVEEWFYVLMPLSTLFLLHFIQQPKKTVFLFATVMLVVPFLLRILFFVQHPIESLDDWNRYLRHIMVYRLDMIGFGVLAAWLKYYKSSIWTVLYNYKWLGILLLLASTIAYHFYAFGFMFLSLFYFSIVGVGLLLLLPTIESMKCTSPRIISTVTFLSVISYAVYLLNRSVILYPLILPFKPVFASSVVLTLGAYVGYVILVMLIAYGFYRFVEQPILAFRDKLDIKKRQ
ncbi:MAG: acyltransferase [Chitinophagales bacterium]